MPKREKEWKIEEHIHHHHYASVWKIVSRTLILLIMFVAVIGTISSIDRTINRELYKTKDCYSTCKGQKFTDEELGRGKLRIDLINIRNGEIVEDYIETHRPIIKEANRAECIRACNQNTKGGTQK